MKTTIEILKRMRQLVAKEGGCRFADLAADAVKGGWDLSSQAKDALDAAHYSLRPNPKYTQAEVVAKFDEAIAAEEAKATA